LIAAPPRIWMRALQSTSTGTPSGAARRDRLATSENRSTPLCPGVGVHFTHGSAVGAELCAVI
jgi:hypothetical protein